MVVAVAGSPSSTSLARVGTNRLASTMPTT